MGTSIQGMLMDFMKEMNGLYGKGKTIPKESADNAIRELTDWKTYFENNLTVFDYDPNAKESVLIAIDYAIEIINAHTKDESKKEQQKDSKDQLKGQMNIFGFI